MAVSEFSFQIRRLLFLSPQHHTCISASFTPLLAARKPLHKHSTDLETTLLNLQRDINWKIWCGEKKSRYIWKSISKIARGKDEGMGC